MISEACPEDEQNVVWLTESISVNAGVPGGKASKPMMNADATDRCTMGVWTFLIVFLLFERKNHL
jgi:hypothetical protein